jgi:hypothetical protein
VSPRIGEDRGGHRARSQPDLIGAPRPRCGPISTRRCERGIDDPRRSGVPRRAAAYQAQIARRLVERGLVRADAAFSAGETARAIKILDGVLALDPGDSRVAVRLARFTARARGTRRARLALATAGAAAALVALGWLGSVRRPAAAGTATAAAITDPHPNPHPDATSNLRGPDPRPPPDSGALSTPRLTTTAARRLPGSKRAEASFLAPLSRSSPSVILCAARAPRRVEKSPAVNSVT